MDQAAAAATDDRFDPSSNRMLRQADERMKDIAMDLERRIRVTCQE